MDQLWFLLALIPPFLFAITNHTDKILLEKYFKEGGVGTLILISSLLSILPLPFIFWVSPSVLEVDVGNIPILALAGILNVALIWFYLRAMRDEEASIVIVYYQIVPVLALIFGYFILDEVISSRQFIAMFIIIVGTAIISFEMGVEEILNEAEEKAGKKPALTFKKGTVFNMLGACTCWALETAIFKKVAQEDNLWRSLFWEQLIMVLVGVLIFIFIPIYRKHFMTALRKNSKAILSLNAMNETLYIIGGIVGAAAAMLAPIALVLLAQPFQSFFVLGIGIFLTVFFPQVLKEKVGARHLWQKFTAVVITGVGTYVLLT